MDCCGFRLLLMVKLTCLTVGGSDSTFVDEGSSTLYRLIVQDSLSNEIITNSTFEITNTRPDACLDLDGSLAGIITENIPVRMDASCSSDFDNDDLTYNWEIDGVMVTSAELSK